MNSSDFKVILLLLGALGVWGWWHNSHAHSKSATVASVAGRAVDVRGQGIQGAEITLRSESGQVVAHTTTGSDGRFDIRGCEPGHYSLVASKAGVGGGERSITVDRRYGAETQVSLDGVVRTR